MEENIIEKVVREISENHHKIIDDWCKAYMAQIYQEGFDIKPGCFTLLEQEPTMQDGIFAKRYWFKYGTPNYPEYTNWVKCSDRMPEEGVEVLIYWEYKNHKGIDIDKIFNPKDGNLWKCTAKEAVKAWMPLPELPIQDE